MLRLEFYFGSVATGLKGYHSPQQIHSFTMDSGEYVNKVQMYHGTLASTIDGGWSSIMTGIRFITNKGTNECFKITFVGHMSIFGAVDTPVSD